MSSIVLDHGAGGRASRQLVTDIFAKHLSGPLSETGDDAAVLPRPEGRLSVSTDSFTVSPIFFPGGNIGDLAVHGTVNDVAMRGAKVLYLTCGFILEEGLSLDELERVVIAMAHAAQKAGVQVIAGDTKVVGRGQADKIFINTTGIGVIPDGLELGADRIRPGDAVLVSGTVGDHGITIMAEREGLGLDSSIQSDSAALNGLIADLLAACPGIKALRDPTRGGLATACVELADVAGCGMALKEADIPVRDSVRGVCELLGLDPYYLANEGKLIVVVDEAQAEKALEVIRAHELGGDGAIIGHAVEAKPGRVWLETAVGGRRILDMLTGEPLPRIC